MPLPGNSSTLLATGLTATSLLVLLGIQRIRGARLTQRQTEINAEEQKEEEEEQQQCHPAISSEGSTLADPLQASADASSRQLQQAPISAGSMADNNNDQSVSNNNFPVEEEMKGLAIGVGERERVNNWLERNQPFSHDVDATAGHESAAAAAAASSSTEEASDDSGRPSSVDTVGNSPRSSARPTARLGSVVRGVSPLPGDDNDIVHQFLIPNKLGGSMVGTRGRNINYIRAKSGASVWISRNFFDKKTQVVNVRGPVECVKVALQVIKKRFPELDVKPINTAVPIQRNPALQPTMCQLNLPVGVAVDVNVCAMCRGTTLFLQQPTHPSFHHLEKMDLTIAKHYSDQDNVPNLPRPVNPGAVCVAPFGAASWHRAIIADVYPEEDAVLMRYLDWGGYERMPVGCLKQIRTEMMHLPFQSVEAHLAYVTPLLSTAEDVECQLDELSRRIHEQHLGGGRRVKCQVVYYNDIGQPCVYVYVRDGQGEPWRLLQDELVNCGLAQWFQVPHVPPQMPQAN